MRLVKTLAKVIFGLIIVIAIGGYFFIRNFDLNKYKPYAAELVKNELGRTLAIDGDARVGISLVPTVVVNDVALSNPSWAKNSQMLKVKQLEVKFAVLPLLKKQVVIDKVELINPEIYLETAKDGQQSWDFKGKTPAETLQKAARDTARQAPEVLPATAKEVKNHPEMAFLAGFAARSVLIEKGIVEYYDAKKNQETSVVINQVKMSAPGADEEMTASFDVLYDKQKIKGDLTLGSLQTLMENKNPYPFDLAAEALGIDINLKGTAADIMSAPHYAVQANIYNPAGNLKAPEATLKALVKGDLKKADADIQLLNIVNNMITGKAAVNWSGKVPSVTASLSSDKINLQNFSQNSNFAFVLPAVIGEAQALPIPNDAIPYEVLQQANAKADVKIGTLVIAPGMQAEKVNLNANLQNGVLNVNPLNLEFGGGNLDVTAVINANSRSAQLKAVSRNMKLQNLHSEFQVSGKNDFGVLSGGSVDLDINVSGSGNTYKQLAESLSGTAIVIVDKSVLQTGGLKFMTGNFITQLLTALNIDTSKARELDLSCAVVRADFGSGKAVFPKGIALSAKQLSLVSDGSINLVNDKLDFSIRPFAGKLADTNVVQALSNFIKVRGTIEAPKLTLDDKETLKTIVGIAATGGTAYLGSKVLLDAESSPCYTALEGTPYAARFPKPTGMQAATQDVYKDTVKGVDDSIKDLKNAAKDFLGAFKKTKK